MRLLDFYYANCDIIVDANKGIGDRVNALKNIIEFASGVSNPTPYFLTLLQTLASEFEAGADESELAGLLQEMAKELGFSREGKLMIVLSEENSVSEVLRKCADKDIVFASLWSAAKGWADYYDYFIQTGKQPFPEDWKNEISPDKFINLYDICIYHLCTNPSSYKIFSRYQENIDEAVTFVTGMSYTRNAILPELYGEKLVNVANSSQDIYYDYQCFKDAYSKNSGLKNLVVGLAPYSLRYDLSKTRMDYRVFYYQGFLDDVHNNVALAAELKAYHEHFRTFQKVFGNAMFDSLFDVVADASRISSVEKRNYIFDPNNIKPAEIDEMTKKFQKPFDDTLAENKEILKDYIADALSKGLNVIVFMPPYTEWYRQHWDEAYVAELNEYVDELSHTMNFQVLDMSSVELPNSCFGDYAHLNGIGAVFVASILNQYL